MASAAGAPPAAAAAAAAPSWDGSGTQAELMAKDECILVDESDNIVGYGSKEAAHRFEGATPTGRLHRAFSVFLFDAEGRLLLQQRAASKITFPSLWTNTCCSHPLAGQAPPEVDAPGDVASGAVPGAKRAAVRKLAHELGVAPAALPAAAFRYLTRLHYCARDATTWGGPGARWGEHEVDYILFARAPPALALAPNPEEVAATRWVTRAELADMMAPASGLLWSPWFRIIAANFLDRWWADLTAALGSDAHLDAATIHRLEAE
jgi:isopentenyl-diphosphate delta-isomerase